MKNMLYRWINRIRLKQKLFLSYLIVIIIPITVLGIYNYWQSKQLLGVQAEQSLERSADTIAQNMNFKLEQYRNTANIILYNSAIQKIVSTTYLDYVNLRWDLDQYLYQQFKMIVALNKEIVHLTIYTEADIPESGTALVSATRVANEAWYKQAVGHSAPVWGWDSGHVYLASPFPSLMVNGKNNVLYMNIDYDQFFAPISQLTSDLGIIVADTAGEIIYSNQGQIDDRLGMADMKEQDIIKSDGGTSLIGGQRMLVVKNAISQGNWFMYTYVPVSQVSPDAGNIIKATLIVIGLCLLLLIGIILLLSNTMIKRIHLLLTWMKRVEQGELNLQIKTTSTDEIGDLTVRFGNMLHRLNNLIQEVYANTIVQKEAELRALQAQISPHFLYNTLSFINWRALRSDEHEISHVVTSLSKFYRTVLNKGDQIIAVKDEIDNIKSYLDIVRMMKDNSFDVIYEIDERIYSYRMINFILQPLVENAIQHGIEKDDSDKGILRITASLEQDTILFTVEDNGVGIPEEIIGELLTAQSSGYGLKNVNERIQLKFGSEYGIEISSQIGKGTVMKVVIPRITR
ncbi:cache domain-containing sensor histidine kinase [Paenibacillus spongiae]|uniref:histidine kinase n=1 Tax=Paenibacillus spongiae TaxID=2909671 RepID=A0ABY5SKR1_9BACL|nr:sensor histidine kinase [Paenibacillus spongiae]UVI33168.1 sensor histidine kinase [Paenibacillus spongiae]